MIYPTDIRSRITWTNALRILVPVAATIICCTILWQRIVAMDGAAIGLAITQVTWVQWALAMAATWCSFQAIGQYDAMGHKFLRTGVNPQMAKRAGIRAVAIAQTLGFGAVTGSFVRWRCLPDLSLWQATRVSLAVTIAFTACWAALAICALWWLDGGDHQLRIPLPALVIGLGLFGLALAIGRKRFLPNLRVRDIGSMALLCATDMAFAATALFLLLPAGIDLPFDTLLAAYVVALGVGLISNTPGGAGVFDLVLLSLLPMEKPEPLVATIIAFRIIYYLLPAMLSLIAIARPAPATLKGPHSLAAWGLARQSGTVKHIGPTPAMVGDLPGLLISIGPQQVGLQLPALRKHALSLLKSTSCYNADARMALQARKMKWCVKRVAMEAMIHPASWTTAGGKRQTLRRKLKQAARAGISVEQAQTDPGLDDLQSIACEWAKSHGGELGFSMGRFCPDYIASQVIFLIKINGQTAGFITFHTSRTEWTLDLIRYRDALPDGAMHAAVVAAIAAARQAGIQQLSLATVPDPRTTPAFWAKRRAGLIQFKRSFAPIWVGRYHAAPTRASFWFSAIVIGLTIHRPIANLPRRIALKLNSIMQKYQVRKAA